VNLPSSNQGPWERVIDKTSGQPYWWNAKTGTADARLSYARHFSRTLHARCAVHKYAVWLC
jgi:hypothetical protein